MWEGAAGLWKRVVEDFPALAGMWEGATGLWKKVAEDFPALAGVGGGAAGLWVDEGLKNLLAGPVGTGGGGEND